MIVESYFATLLDLEDNPVEALPLIKGGSITASDSSDVQASGSVQFTSEVDINWGLHRVRLSGHSSLFGDVPLGVYSVSVPSESYWGDIRTQKLDLIDKVAILRDAVFTTSYSVPAGYPVVSAVRDIIALLGETNITVTATDAQATSNRVWLAGTSYLTAVNELLASINYLPIKTNASGAFVSTPWVSLTAQSPRHTFGEFSPFITAATYDRETSFWDTSNQVTLVSSEDSFGNIFTVTVVNDDPASPTSTVSLGGRVVNPIVESDVVAVDQATLEQMALKRLEEASIVSSTVSIEHALTPIWVGDLVGFQVEGRVDKASVSSIRIPLSAGDMLQTELKVL